MSSDITRRAALCGLAGASFAACGQLSAASAPGIPETTGYANVPGGRVWWLRVRIQAGLMRHLGFTEAGQGKMPDGCVAKTAMKWKP